MHRYCILPRDMPHDSEMLDHFPLGLDLLCNDNISTPSADMYTCSTPIPSQSSFRPQFKYGGSQADAYQQRLTAVLPVHLVPLLTGAVDVDNVVAILITCMMQAAQQSLPEQRKCSVKNFFCKESLEGLGLTQNVKP